MKRDNIRNDDQLRDLVGRSSRQFTTKPDPGPDLVRALYDEHLEAKGPNRGKIDIEGDE